MLERREFLVAVARLLGVKSAPYERWLTTPDDKVLMPRVLVYARTTYSLGFSISEKLLEDLA